MDASKTPTRKGKLLRTNPSHGKKTGPMLIPTIQKTTQSTRQSVSQKEKKNKNQSESMVQQNSKSVSRKSEKSIQK